MLGGHCTLAEDLKKSTTVRSFSLRHLDSDRVFLAYPLVRSAMPDVTLDNWSAFAAAFVDRSNALPHGKILTVENESGVIIGLASYRHLPDLRHGWILLVDHLFAFELLDRRHVAELIVDALEAEADRLGCRAIHLALAVVDGKQRPAWLVALLQTRGHHVASMSLCKRLVPA